MVAKVKLIAGAVRSGKTTRLLDRYRESLNSLERDNLAGRALWIGPSSHAAIQVRERLLCSANEAFLDPQVLTFAGFAESIIAGSERPIRPISRLQKRRILQQVVDNALDSAKLKHFSQVAKTPGFLAQVDEFIAELKRQDVWPEDFVKLCRLPRERDLAVIYDHYQQRLNESDLYDAEGRFWAARTELRQSAESFPAESVPAELDLIVVDGFGDFTASQYDILKLLSDRTGELLISLTLDPKSVDSNPASDGRSLLFSKPSNTLEKLKQKLPGIEIELGGTAHFANPALTHLEQHLFRDPDQSAPAAPTAEGIEIVAADGVHGEIEEIARRIKALLLSGQARPQDIVVVFRSLNSAASRLSEVFSDHGIPHWLGPWQDLASSPLHRGIRSLLQLHNENWPFRQLLSVTGNRLFRRFDVPSEDEKHSAPDARIAMELCLRAAQHPAGEKAVLKQLSHWASAASDESDGHEKTSRDERLEKRTSQAKLALSKLKDLAGLLGQLPRQATLGEWIGHIEQLVVGLDVFAVEGEALTPCLSNLASSWSLLRSGLIDLEMVDGCQPSGSVQLSVADLLEVLERVGSELQLRPDCDEVGRVRVLGAEAARYISAKQVFLAGLSEQAFSAYDPGDPLLNGRDLKWLDRQPEDQESEDPHAGDEMLLFYELVTRATEKLTLSYAALDAKGQTLSPSPFLTELEQCFGETAIPRTEMSLGEGGGEGGGEGLGSPNPMSSGDLRRQAVAQALAGDRSWLAGIAAQPESARLGDALLDGIQCVASRGERGEFGSYDGLLLSETSQAVLAKRFDAKHLWSPSQLEGYAACPFRFFSEQILALEPPDELTLRSDVRRRGSLLHQVLATLHAHLAGTLGEEPSQLIERFHQVLSETIESSPLDGLQRWLREIERREIEAWAEQYAQQEFEYRGKWSHLDEPLNPTHFEVRFGPQVRSDSSTADDSASTALPFELDLGSEQILLTGQIDRVDMGRIGKTKVFNIIDYKSGAEVKLQADKICSGRQLQLPLYALAAEKLLLADQDAVALSTGYWSIQGQGFGGRRSSALDIREISDQGIQTSQQWDELQPLILERIGQLVAGIRGGQFPVFNEDESCTRYCSFSTICRVAHLRSLEKVWVGEGK